MVVVKPRLYIIQNAQIFKQADILEGTGNSALIDFNGLFSCNIFSVQYDASRIDVYKRQILDGTPCSFPYLTPH